MAPDYAIRRQVNAPFDEALERVTAALAEEGFGIMSDIDVQAKMKEKLDRQMPPYRILGACAPPLAWEALQSVPDIGVFLPCNVVVREQPDGSTSVSAMDPDPIMQIVQDSAVTKVAQDARERLERALERL